ncbi:GNAT family N-acetyltransferase [Bacillus sp. ISL-47]|uniref:GNAT family N-acetyltransferase n=1 Tax=Bacillus sp. ISL-47 TaxID=2819130 RepID=UPI001BE85111|nr:GNAT family N-acetyltransferase [Bacillus sp. ISL-47]MBT2687483.1 GNAT family N-acetyltransferase [Bacillus sp. ISL-47]MBT2711166.1 GNAT family N-acetyltransferase [Pseudomonas sp. ISL-84]
MIKAELKTFKITKKYEAAAKQLILEGFLERFGFIDHSLNPDLNNITKTYSLEGSLFLIGFIGEEMVCTGALTKESGDICRLQRMSVKTAFRNRGIARTMVQVLESQAQAEGYKKIVLETHLSWSSAVTLYKSCGYKEYLQEEGMIHLFKSI